MNTKLMAVDYMKEQEDVLKRLNWLLTMKTTR